MPEGSVGRLCERFARSAEAPPAARCCGRARRRKKRLLKPRDALARRKKKRAAAARSPASGAVGLGLVALGLFLCDRPLLRLERRLRRRRSPPTALDALSARPRTSLPVACVVVGALMVARSELVDMRPFRTGLAVFVARADADARPGARRLRRARRSAAASGSCSARPASDRRRSRAGRRRAAADRRLRRRVDPALAAALSRRAGGQARTAALPAACARPSRSSARPRAPSRRSTRVHEFPDVVGGRAAAAARAARRARRGPDRRCSTSSRGGHGDYRLPDREAPAHARRPQAATRRRRTSGSPRRSSRRSRTSASRRPSSARSPGPRVTRYELQLAPGTKVSKVAALKDDL